MKHPDVDEVVVVAIEDTFGTKVLSAYFVANVNITNSELRNFLIKSLPNFMVPTYFTQLKKCHSIKMGKLIVKHYRCPTWIQYQTSTMLHQKVNWKKGCPYMERCS